MSSGQKAACIWSSMFKNSNQLPYLVGRADSFPLERETRTRANEGHRASRTMQLTGVCVSRVWLENGLKLKDSWPPGMEWEQRTPCTRAAPMRDLLSAGIGRVLTASTPKYVAATQRRRYPG